MYSRQFPTAAQDIPTGYAGHAFATDIPAEAAENEPLDASQEKPIKEEKTTASTSNAQSPLGRIGIPTFLSSLVSPFRQFGGGLFDYKSLLSGDLLLPIIAILLLTSSKEDDCEKKDDDLWLLLILLFLMK